MGGKSSKTSKAPVFRDIYEVGEKLGEGAFGVVHETVHRASGESYAVKMIDRAFADASEMERETEMLRSLEHPNIVRCVDVFTDQCFTYIVMVKMTGGDMVDGLQSHLKSKGKIPDVKTISPVKQMLTAIAFIHSKGVIHRDVKGDNFLMDRPDIVHPDCVVALSDFGTAIFLQKGHKLSEHTGTSIFWAPEVINKHYEFLADVWAVGVVFFGLLDGTFPFRDARQIQQKPLRNPKASRACLQLLHGMLEKDPSQRLSAEQCLNNPWIKTGGQGASSKKDSKDEEKEEKKEPEKKDAEAEAPRVNLKQEGVNDAIAQRRQQLVRQLEEEQQKGGKKGGGKRLSLVGSAVCNSQNFTINGTKAGEKITYEWCDSAECDKRGIKGLNTEGAKPLDLTDVEKASPDSIKTILVKHDVDTSRFGYDSAKTIVILCANACAERQFWQRIATS
jgi:calcium-dependent protein kinase